MTLLPASLATDLALRALIQQGQYGVVTDLAREHEVSRTTVYTLRERAQQALIEAFTPDEPGVAPLVELHLHRNDLARSLIALRVMAPCSTWDIEDLLPVLYQWNWSHGTVHALLAEAEQRAAAFNRQVDLAGITHGALDEMFSQGYPVFGGIGLDTGYLFALERHPDRSGETWTAVLQRLRDDQGLQLKAVVKDAAAAMTQAVDAVYGEDIEQRDDSFHLTYLMGKTAYWLEQRAYAALQQEYDWEDKRHKVWKYTASERRVLGQKWRQAKQQATAAIARYDRFCELREQARALLEPIEWETGRLHSATELREGLERIAGEMRELGGEKVRKVATYMANRAEGLSLYLAAMSASLTAANAALETPGVAEAVVWTWQASVAVHQKGPIWDRPRRQAELRRAVRHLLALTDSDPERLLAAYQQVMPIILARHRASSAIENLNSVLRPYLVVQKGAHSGFLELFRFWWNTRTRRWGRHEKTSAYELLTGEKVTDWLTLLGYPPGPTTSTN
jgi:hypothetical protein